MMTNAFVAAMLVTAVATPALAVPAKDPVVAQSVIAVCTGSSRYPVPQSLRIELTAANVRRSMQAKATCGAALTAVRRIAKTRRDAKGYTCTATGPGPEDFIEHDTCTLTRAGTTIRLRFDLILD